MGFGHYGLSLLSSICCYIVWRKRVLRSELPQPSGTGFEGRIFILQQAHRYLANSTAVLPAIRIVDANGAYSHVGLVQVRTASDGSAGFGTVCGMNLVGMRFRCSVVVIIPHAAIYRQPPMLFARSLDLISGL